MGSGRVLGPLDLERVRLLILKNQIIGTETAREHPDGDWKDINAIPEIATLLLKRASGDLATEASHAAATAPTQELPGATLVLPPTGVMPLEPLPELATLSRIEDDPLPAPLEEQASVPLQQPGESLPPAVGEARDDDGDKTVVASAEDLARAPVSVESAAEAAAVENEKTEMGISPATSVELDRALMPALERNISTEKTIVFHRSDSASRVLDPSGKRGPEGGQAPRGRPQRPWLKKLTLVLVVILAAWELLSTEPTQQNAAKPALIRPRLPEVAQKQADPQKSGEHYQRAMKHYIADTVAGYRQAVAELQQAASYDINNVKALAMLASSYINLIDSSSKDENYFKVISTLIEMSRAKSIDLPETVISDVEFYLIANKPEAAQSRIVSYTKTHPNFGLEMFYYLALAFYNRGDAGQAARFLSQFPEQKAFSPKIFYLAGLIAEKVGDVEAAKREYDKAIRFSAEHGRSRLRLIELAAKSGDLKSVAAHIEYLIAHPALLSPRDLAAAYYYRSQWNQVLQKWDVALGDIEKALQLDRGNRDYLLESYMLRAKAGDSIKSLRGLARMYFFLGEGEKRVRDGQYHEALSQFLLARQANEKSPMPLVKMGDMFTYLHDLGNARLNYKLATDRAATDIDIWSKYIDVLIQSFEWEEAQKAMDRFRKIPGSASTIDKLAADMYAKQGRHAEAQSYYRKAMARETIDPSVYIAYANSLVAADPPVGCKEAPFFFALALRFDPLNFNAIIGTAKCVATIDSIDRGISLLQDELQKASASRAELLSAIAELQLQKGDVDLAQGNINQAMAANPDYAHPWRLQAQIHMGQQGLDRNAVSKALDAYKSYSDRNRSDPFGYFERYKIFTHQSKYEQAGDELKKIYEIYPKYPKLHYFQGVLYAMMSNHRRAIDEFNAELKNNPFSDPTWIALGKLQIELGDAQKALESFNKAMQIAPLSAEAKHWAGYANHSLKNYMGAIALYQAALAIDQANPLIQKRLGQAYEAAGDGVAAAAAYRRYLQLDPEAADRALYEKYR